MTIASIVSTASVARCGGRASAEVCTSGGRELVQACRVRPVLLWRGDSVRVHGVAAYGGYLGDQPLDPASSTYGAKSLEIFCKHRRIAI